MSQRNSEYPRKERDLYETPEWVTHALIPHLSRFPHCIWEPACGSGEMTRVLTLHGAYVMGSDIEPGGCDFLLEQKVPEVKGTLWDAIITNPPYELAQQFCEHALRLIKPTLGMVAMLLRTDFDHAKSRGNLFRDCPAFAKKVVLTKRIVWFVEANGKPKAAPSYNHAWFVWDWRHQGPPTIGYAP